MSQNLPPKLAAKILALTNNCFFFLGFVTIQLNAVVESHGLHNVAMPKKGTEYEYSSIGVFNILPFLLLIAIDNQFYSSFLK
jgi:hypothetical protein